MDGGFQKGEASGFLAVGDVSGSEAESSEISLNTEVAGRSLQHSTFLATMKAKLALVGKREKVVDVSKSEASEEYRLYPWRWFMLLALCLLNVSNGTMWLTFAPIPNYTAVFYGISLEQVDWFSISFFAVSLLIGFLAIAILDIFGLRVSLYLGAGFNLLGSLLRWVSSTEAVLCSGHYRRSGFVVAMAGQILTACAQPFLLYAPTKLASTWFGPKERSLCTMLATLGNPVGIAIAQLVSPNVVSSLDRFSTLHMIYTVLAALSVVLTGAAFWRKKPAVDPAPSAHKSDIPFLAGLKHALTTPSFLCLLIVWGCPSAIFNAFLTLLAAILCPHGYTNRQSGLWGALMVFSGLVGATVGGLVMDFFKLFKEVAVISLALSLLCFALFIEVFSLTGQGVIVAISVSLFGFFGFPLIPACMELGVEVTYPVAEATSSGLLWSVTQVMGIVLVLIGQAIQSDVLVEGSACLVQEVSNSSLHCLVYPNSSYSDSEEVVPHDFTNPLLFYMAAGTASLLIMVIFFRPKYRRLEVEQRAERIHRQLRVPTHKRSSPSAPPHVPTSPDAVKALPASPTTSTLRIMNANVCHTSTEF